MGLLNHLFGTKADTAKELVMADDERLALWQQHLANHPKRELLSKHFSFGNIKRALQDFNATVSILEQIESLIASELINISNEEKLEKEIIKDLGKLKSTGEIERILDALIDEKRKQAILRKLFQEIHNVLKAELHLINLIKKRPANVEELLLKLFKLIFHNEAFLYKPFKEESYFEENKHIHARISEIVRAIIFEEALEEEIETEEEIFAKRMVRLMASDEPESEYRKLAVDIFVELAHNDKVGAPLPKEAEWDEAMEMMQTLMNDDAVLYAIIKELKPEYDDKTIRVVISAFRKAHEMGHFEELYAEFAT